MRLVFRHSRHKVYTFLPGSKLLFHKEGTGLIEINPESLSLDQTFQETNFSRKTLQEKFLVNESIVQKKATASFSFGYYLSDDVNVDGHILEWFFDDSGPVFNMPVLATTSIPVQRDFYLNTIDGKKLKVSGAVIESYELEIGPNKLSKAIVSGTAKLLEVVDSIPSETIVPHNKGYHGNHHIQVEVGGADTKGIINTIVAIRKSIDWLDQPTLHSSEAGELYVPSIPIHSDFSISGRFTTVLTNNTIEEKDDTLKIVCGSLSLDLAKANFTDRVGVDNYLTKTTDFKAVPSYGDYTITY